MKIALVVMGVAGLLCNGITSVFRFVEGRPADGVAWLLLAIMVLVMSLTTARDW